MHDMDKFRPDMFINYARLFYGTYPKESEIESWGCDEGTVLTKEDVESASDYCWNAHQKRNKHHWQYWILHNDDGSTYALPIPETYLKEMLCDWIGAGKAQGKTNKGSKRFDEVKLWYNANKDNMVLNCVTRKELEQLIFLD